MSIIGYGSVNSGSASVGTASAQVLPANPQRRGLVLANVGTVPVYLRFGTAEAVVGEGLRLAAGGTYEMTRGWRNVWSGAIQGIAAQDGGGVAYSEGQ